MRTSRITGCRIRCRVLLKRRFTLRRVLRLTNESVHAVKARAHRPNSGGFFAFRMRPASSSASFSTKFAEAETSKRSTRS